jgi:hypothetical protein
MGGGDPNPASKPAQDRPGTLGKPAKRRFTAPAIFTGRTKTIAISSQQEAGRRQETSQPIRARASSRMRQNVMFCTFVVYCHPTVVAAQADIACQAMRSANHSA